MNIADTFGSVLDYLVNEACKDFDGSAVTQNPTDYRKKRDMLLKAYNRYQDEERNCADHIYDSNNNEDMISLLKGGDFNIWDLSKKLYDEFPYLLVHWNAEKKENELESIDGCRLENIFKTNMREIMECVILYAPYTEDYMNVYKAYISEVFEREN